MSGPALEVPTEQTVLMAVAKASESEQQAQPQNSSWKGRLLAVIPPALAILSTAGVVAGMSYVQSLGYATPLAFVPTFLACCSGGGGALCCGLTCTKYEDRSCDTQVKMINRVVGTGALVVSAAVFIWGAAIAPNNGDPG